MQRAHGQGRMAAVALGADGRSILSRVTTVAYQCRRITPLVVLSGDATSLAEVLTTLQARGVRCRY